MDNTSISRQALGRMPYYLGYLKKLEASAIQNVSAPIVAAALGLNEVQVRKDLAAVSHTAGKPRTGFVVAELVRDIEHFLGYDDVNNAVLIGAGALGRALLSYKGFSGYGLEILAAGDIDPALIGTEINGKRILEPEHLAELCRRAHVHIGIITVPADQAQAACDLLLSAGILAIWNFAPTHLEVPDDILVHNENIASSLALLSKHLTQRLDRESN